MTHHSTFEKVAVFLYFFLVCICKETIFEKVKRNRIRNFCLGNLILIGKSFENAYIEFYIRFEAAKKKIVISKRLHEMG